jgi:hypothetical protein
MRLIDFTKRITCGRRPKRYDIKDTIQTKNEKIIDTAGTIN